MMTKPPGLLLQNLFYEVVEKRVFRRMKDSDIRRTVEALLVVMVNFE